MYTWNPGYRSCNYCKTPFDPCGDSKKRYCSEECHQAYLQRMRIRYVPKSEKHDNCLFCGKNITERRIGTKYCSDFCSEKARNIKKGLIEDHGELLKKCPICGKDFKTWKSKKETCSPECSKKYHLADRRLADRIIDRGITLEKLSARDGNQCQICGLFVDWTDFVKHDNHVTCGRMYPSIDHIKPLSLGGLHSWGNVQLAHMVCNTRKNNRYIG